jgi:hypothetical protein
MATAFRRWGLGHEEPEICYTTVTTEGPGLCCNKGLVFRPAAARQSSQRKQKRKERKNIGQETISGFSPQHDLIEINHTLIGSFKGVLADAHQVGADTVITIDASNAITLTGVAVSSLHAHDFHFV